MRRFSTEDRANCVAAFADVVVLPLDGVAAGEFLIGGGLDFLEGDDEGLLLREAMANVGGLGFALLSRSTRDSRVGVGVPPIPFSGGTPETTPGTGALLGQARCHARFERVPCPPHASAKSHFLPKNFLPYDARSLFRGTQVPVRALFENLEAGARVRAEGGEGRSSQTRLNRAILELTQIWFSNARYRRSDFSSTRLSRKRGQEGSMFIPNHFVKEPEASQAREAGRLFSATIMLRVYLGFRSGRYGVTRSGVSTNSSPPPA